MGSIESKKIEEDLKEDKFLLVTLFDRIRKVMAHEPMGEIEKQWQMERLKSLMPILLSSFQNHFYMEETYGPYEEKIKTPKDHESEIVSIFHEHLEILCFAKEIDWQINTLGSNFSNGLPEIRKKLEKLRQNWEEHEIKEENTVYTS